MNKYFKSESFYPAVLVIFYTVFFSSLFFSWRAVSSISIALILIAGIIKHKGSIRPIAVNKRSKLLLAACTLYFLLQIVSLFYTDNRLDGWKNIRLQSGLLFVPLAVILSGPFTDKTRKKILAGYYWPLFVACLYCLVKALLLFADKGETHLLFYHQLVKPLQQHAVYFSIFVFIALVLLLESRQKKTLPFAKIFSIALVIFFTVFLFLLASKLVISFYLFYLLYYIISLVKKNILPRKAIAILLTGMILLATTIFFTSNPISDRFRDIMTNNLALVEKDSYQPSDYFNGVQFRLLQWKLVPEILTVNKSWALGVGPGNTQTFLDREYAAKNMYLGNGSGNEKGYRAYNTHNQFLESLLKNGIAGLMAFCFIFYALARMAWQKRNRGTVFIVALLLCYALIESILETQFGIILFTFFPVFLCQEP